MRIRLLNKIFIVLKDYRIWNKILALCTTQSTDTSNLALLDKRGSGLVV